MLKFILIIFGILMFSFIYPQLNLNQEISNQQENITSKNTINNPQIILEQMIKKNQNNSTNEILNITIEKKLIKELELEKMNKEFQKITNNSTIIQANNTQQTIFNSTWYKPIPKTSWQWQLSKNIDTTHDVEMYDVDLVETPQNIIDELHNKNIKVICYFSAGSVEEYREDAKEFPQEIIGHTLDGWEDEKWLDTKNFQKFSHIIKTRLDLAVTKKCDGVEPDNVDGYTNNNGFKNTYQDQLTYNLWLAREAHKRNLSIGLKNDLEQIKELEPHFDFAINEQCFEYDECELLLPFIENKKAVFNAEYELKTSEFCDKAIKLNFSSLLLNYNLDGNRISCD